MDDACKALLAMAPAVLADPGLIWPAALRALDRLGGHGPRRLVCVLPPGCAAPSRAGAGGRALLVPAESAADLPGRGAGELALLLPAPEALAGARSLSHAAARLVRSRLADLVREAGPERELRVAVWGAGHYGRGVMEGFDWPAGARLVAAVDANPAAHGADFAGLPVRPVQDLDAVDCDVAVVCIVGHRGSVRAMQASLGPREYYSPFEALGGGGPERLALLAALARAGYAPGDGLLDLADWTLWLTPDKGWMDALRACALEVWREALAADLEGLAALAPAVRRATGDCFPGCLDSVLGGLNRSLARVSACHQGLSQGLGKWLDVLDWERRCLAGAGLRPEGLRVLDIGFGSTLLNALLLLCEGAGRVVSLDPGGRPEVCESWTSLSGPLFWRLFGGFAEAAERDRALAVLPAAIQGLDPASGRLRLDRALLDHRYCGLEELDAPEASFDVAFSNTVLEHVLAMPAAAANLFRVLKPGGLAFHFVDYAPHCDAHHFSVYAHDPRSGTYVNPDGVALNLLRSPQYLEIFRSAGFEAQHRAGTAVAYGPEHLAAAHPAFRDQGAGVLAERSAHFILRKPL